ncbi:MAG: metallophosphoesterase family protein [Bryobacteraceae bacterium]
MRHLIVSDIHANLEALDAVLADAKGSYDRILCCGDIVGYGADPDAVTAWARQNVDAVIRGNHDKACAGLEDLEWFNPVARLSTLWTMEHMDLPNIEWLRGLPQGPVEEAGLVLVHGSPLDEDEYLVSELDVEQILPYLGGRVWVFGHSHLQGGFLCHRNGVQRIRRSVAASESMQLEADQPWLINPGSVGQPRDGDPRAAWMLWDSDERVVTFCRTAYDVRAAQKKILDAGLPEILASRLEAGK